MKRLLVLLAIMLLACATFSCKSGPEAQDDQNDETVEREIVGVDEGLALARADQPGVLAKIRLDRVDRIAPALEVLAKKSSGPDQQLLENLAAGDWPSLFSRITRNEPPETLGLDETAPVYVALATVDGDTFGEAFSHGAPIQPDDALPVALRTRIVVRAENPDALEAAFEQTRTLASRADRSLSLSREGDYVVADYVRVRPDLDSFMSLEAKKQTPRATPAYREFTESTDPLAVYLRTDEVMAYGAAANQFDMARALESARPQYRRQILARTVAANLNLAMFSTPSDRELEDTCIRLTGDGEKMAMLTGLGTQTALGQRLAAANDRVEVVQRAFADDVDTFGRLHANIAAKKMFEAAPVAWTKFRGAPSSEGELVMALRATGWYGYAALLFGSPMLIPRLAYADIPDSRRALLPRALLAEFATSSANGDAAAMPPAVGLTTAYAQSELSDQVVATLRRSLGQIPSRSELQLVTKNHEDGARARAAAGRSLAENPSDVELAPGRVWGRVDLGMLLEMMGQPSYAEGLAPFDSLQADVSMRQSTTRWRVIVGEPGMIGEEVPEMEVTPIAAAPDCVGTSIATRLDLFKGVEAVNASKMSPQDWLDFLENSGVDSVSKQCASDATDNAEAIELARARTGEFMLRYAEMLDKPDVVDALRQRGCDLGDQVQCKMLED